MTPGSVQSQQQSVQPAAHVAVPRQRSEAWWRAVGHPERRERTRVKPHFARWLTRLVMHQDGVIRLGKARESTSVSKADATLEISSAG